MRCGGDHADTADIPEPWSHPLFVVEDESHAHDHDSFEPALESWGRTEQGRRVTEKERIGGLDRHRARPGLLGE